MAQRDPAEGLARLTFIATMLCAVVAIAAAILWVLL